MKYISLDIETTGKDTKSPDRLLQVSMVFEDTDDPKPLDQLDHFTCIVKQYEYIGEPYALWLNSWIFKAIDDSSKKLPTPYHVLSLKDAISGMINFINRHYGTENATVAGKNVASFDVQFLPECVKKRIKHRMIDIGSVFIDFSQKNIPSMVDLHAIYGKMDGTMHDAYYDALDNIRILRKRYEKI